jgi:hypothetical protein
MSKNLERRNIDLDAPDGFGQENQQNQQETYLNRLEREGICTHVRHDESEIRFNGIHPPENNPVAICGLRRRQAHKICVFDHKLSC